MGALFKSSVWYGVGDRDLITGWGAMMCCLASGKDGAYEEGPVLLGKRFSFSASFSFCNFSAFSNHGLYFIFCCLSWSGNVFRTSRESGCVCVITRRGFCGKRHRCPELPSSSPNDLLSHLFLIRNHTKGGQRFSENGGRETEPTGLFTIPVPVAVIRISSETETTDSSRGGFESAGSRNPVVFFSVQEGERWPISPNFQHGRLR